MRLNQEQRQLINRVRALWEQKLDTVGMSVQLQLPEHVIEAALHRAMDLRRSVVGMLKVVE